MTDRCRTCRFWQLDLKPGETDPGEDQDAGFGWCRRQPPKIVEHMAQMLIVRPRFGGQGPYDPDEAANVSAVFDSSLYPATFGTDWCGEFQPIPISRRGFDDALADYLRLRAISDAMPLGHPAEDDAVNAYAQARDSLIIETRAPDLDALSVKLRLIAEAEDGFGGVEAFHRAIIGDVDDLRGAPVETAA